MEQGGVSKGGSWVPLHRWWCAVQGGGVGESEK
jgi:hypothetical protein